MSSYMNPTIVGKDKAAQTTEEDPLHVSFKDIGWIQVKISIESLTRTRLGLLMPWRVGVWIDNDECHGLLCIIPYVRSYLQQ